jgi:hypothetical protein
MHNCTSQIRILDSGPAGPRSFGYGTNKAPREATMNVSTVNLIRDLHESLVRQGRNWDCMGAGLFLPDFLFEKNIKSALLNLYPGELRSF